MGLKTVEYVDTTDALFHGMAGRMSTCEHIHEERSKISSLVMEHVEVMDNTQLPG